MNNRGLRQVPRQVPLCPRCRGEGWINHPISRLPGATARRTCPRCRGRGISL